MKKLIMTVAVMGLVAAQSAFADNPQLQQQLGEQRKQVQTILKTEGGCAMMCEEMLKDKQGRTMMIDTMLKDETTVKELKARLK